MPWIGVAAAMMTSLSYIPQVRKAWPRGSTADLSLTMLTVLTTGLLLWIGYGLLKGDWVIFAANGVGPPEVTIRSTLRRTRSAASSGNRSSFCSANRYSMAMFCPSM